jgi:hypothetical protein
MAVSVPGVVPAAVPRTRRQIWSVGGGKGGIGKSLLTASLGWQLARMGKRVVLVDADLGGANPTRASASRRRRSLGTSSSGGARDRGHVLVERAPAPPGERASDFLGAADIKHHRRYGCSTRSSPRRGRDPPRPGAGSFNIIDFFLISDLRADVVPGHLHRERLPFIKSALSGGCPRPREASRS